MFETGHFASLWRDMAARLGLKVDFVPGDWRHGVDPASVRQKLGEDKPRAIRAVAIVHNETSTGVASRIAAVRRAIGDPRRRAIPRRPISLEPMRLIGPTNGSVEVAVVGSRA